jgi:hypothetical protein
LTTSNDECLFDNIETKINLKSSELVNYENYENYKTENVKNLFSPINDNRLDYGNQNKHIYIEEQQLTTSNNNNYNNNDNYKSYMRDENLNENLLKAIDMKKAMEKIKYMEGCLKSMNHENEGLKGKLHEVISSINHPVEEMEDNYNNKNINNNISKIFKKQKENTRNSTKNYSGNNLIQVNPTYTSNVSNTSRTNPKLPTHRKNKSTIIESNNNISNNYQDFFTERNKINNNNNKINIAPVDKTQHSSFINNNGNSSYNMKKHKNLTPPKLNVNSTVRSSSSNSNSKEIYMNNFCAEIKNNMHCDSPINKRKRVVEYDRSVDNDDDDDNVIDFPLQMKMKAKIKKKGSKKDNN